MSSDGDAPPKRMKERNDKVPVTVAQRVGVGPTTITDDVVEEWRPSLQEEWQLWQPTWVGLPIQLWDSGMFESFGDVVFVGGRSDSSGCVDNSGRMARCIEECVQPTIEVFVTNYIVDLWSSIGSELRLQGGAGVLVKCLVYVINYLVICDLKNSIIGDWKIICDQLI